MTQESAGPFTYYSGSTRNHLAAHLNRKIDKLVNLWEYLGAGGPSFAAPEAGTPELARRKYLEPLARLLVRGLAGSADHTAIYLDERVRYVDTGWSPQERSERMRQQLTAEFAAIAEMLGSAFPPDAVFGVLWDFHAPLIDTPAADTKLLFIGDCLFVETRAFLGPIARDRDNPLDIRHVFFSASQQIASVNTAIVEEVKRFQPDLIGLSLFTFEGVPPYSAAWQQAAHPLRGASALDLVDGLVELVRRTISDIRTVSNCPIVIHAPVGLPLSRLRRRLPILRPHSTGQRRLLRALSTALTELVQATTNTILLEERHVVEEHGTLRAATEPIFDSTDVPEAYFHASRLGPMLADHYNTICVDYQLLRRAKAIFVDFDNTLWRGVMGEGPVEHFKDRQRLLLELKNSGVLLVALSKNDPSAIRWGEMVLSENDFVLKKINWQPKPDNASAGIAELDLGADAFVLLDDNPAERALVTEQVAGVRALDPDRPESWRALRRWLDFPSTSQTQEALRRTTMYREAAERRSALSAGHDYASMMNTLNLRYNVRLARADDMPRLLELIQRTNQFNTTTQRRTAPQVETLLQDVNFGAYVATLKDRFGDLGLVAVAIFSRQRQQFEAVIMSCRAMGFGLELALLRRVMDDEGTEGCSGLFVPTARNAPAADLFARAGFSVDADGVWQLPADAQKPDIPGWLG